MTLCRLDLSKLWGRRSAPTKSEDDGFPSEFEVMKTVACDDAGARVWAPYSAMPELFDVVQQAHALDRRRFWMEVLHTHEVFDRSLGALLARARDLHQKSRDYADFALDMLSHRSLRLRAKLRHFAETDAEFRALLRPETLFMQSLDPVVEARYAVDTDPSPLLFAPPTGIFAYSARTIGNKMIRGALEFELDENNIYLNTAKFAMGSLAANAEVIFAIWQFPRCAGITDVRLEKAINEMVLCTDQFYSKLEGQNFITILYMDWNHVKLDVVAWTLRNKFIRYDFS